MDLKDFKYVVPVEEALSWDLYKKSLRWELTDIAEALALKAGVLSNDDDDNEVAKVECIGTNFIVTFVSAEETPKSENVKFRLTIDVEYKPNGVSHGQLRELLDDIPMRVAGMGNFSGETAAEVEQYSHVVDKIGD